MTSNEKALFLAVVAAAAFGLWYWYKNGSLTAAYTRRGERGQVTVMSTGTTIAIIGGIAVFAVVAYLIVKKSTTHRSSGICRAAAEALL